MEKYREKMDDFVSRLWINPSVRNVPLLKKENQILSFVKENSGQLKGTLTKPQYFPEISWEEIVRLLFTSLTEKVIAAIEPRVTAVINQVNTPELIDFFVKADEDALIDTDALRTFILQNLRNKSMRDQFVNVLDAIDYGLYERYIPALLGRRKVIYYELVRRDRLDFAEHLIPLYLSFASLFRPFFWYKFPSEPGSQNMLSLAGVYRNKRSYPAVKEQLLAVLKEKVGPLPDAISGPGLDSWLNAAEYRELSGSARFITIMVNRASDFDPSQKTERGAETPDKSWFNINRKTAGYYGYDSKFLDELYSIAGEEGW